MTSSARRRAGSRGSPISTSRYDTALEAVKADIALGYQLQITSTPTFFVDGVRIPFRATGQGLQPSGWEEAIRLELKRAGQVK